MKCKKHPKYIGAKPPKIACHDCWAYYFGVCDLCINNGCQETYREATDSLS